MQTCCLCAVFLFLNVLKEKVTWVIAVVWKNSVRLSIWKHLTFTVTCLSLFMVLHPPRCASALSAAERQLWGAVPFFSSAQTGVTVVKKWHVTQSPKINVLFGEKHMTVDLQYDVHDMSVQCTYITSMWEKSFASRKPSSSHDASVTSKSLLQSLCHFPSF